MPWLAGLPEKDRRSPRQGKKSEGRTMATSVPSKAPAGDTRQDNKAEAAWAGEISGTEAAMRALRHDAVHLCSIGTRTTVKARP